MQTGVAGDMILGALFDLGLDYEAWKAGIDTLGLADVHFHRERVSKQGIMATRFKVEAPQGHAHRGLPEIRSIIRNSGVAERAKENALAVFGRLAQVEADIHGVPVENVHFHEVGAHDAIVDIVGACVGFEMLGINEFHATAFTFGKGTVLSQHGRLSVPVPASLALSRGFPSMRTDMPGELSTPTGTAIVSALSKPAPPRWKGRVEKIGYGAGARDLPGIANVLRICLMERELPDASGYEVYQVECNLDDMAPELIGYAAERLLEAGCRDVWQEPIYMKKNRAAVKLCALVEESELGAALSLMASETSTGGMRYFPVRRLVAEKTPMTVETRFGDVAMKKIEFPGRTGVRYSPEFESCRTRALEAKAPLQDVYREALLRAAALEKDEEKK